MTRSMIHRVINSTFRIISIIGYQTRPRSIFNKWGSTVLSEDLSTSAACAISREDSAFWKRAAPAFTLWCFPDPSLKQIFLPDIPDLGFALPWMAYSTNASKRLAVELARPHPPPGRATGNRRVLMNCVRPTADSLFGHVPDLYSRKAAEMEHWFRGITF